MHLFKSLWQTLMPLNGLIIQLEIKTPITFTVVCRHLLTVLRITLPTCLIIFHGLRRHMIYSAFVELCTVCA